jgi:hypothetical protein
VIQNRRVSAGILFHRDTAKLLWEFMWTCVAIIIPDV